jgi:hypothetical protein
MWNEINKEAYMKKVIGLKPLESYTDPDGIQVMSFGRPHILTIWGMPGSKDDDATPIVKCEMNKGSRHDRDWDVQYYEYQP